MPRMSTLKSVEDHKPEASIINQNVKIELDIEQPTFEVKVQNVVNNPRRFEIKDEISEMRVNIKQEHNEDGSVVKQSIENVTKEAYYYSGHWVRPARRRYAPTSEDPTEKLTSLSLRGLSFSEDEVREIDKDVYQCMKCAEKRVLRTFKRRYSCNKHVYIYHRGLRKAFPCPRCSHEYCTPDKMKNHLKTAH